MGADGSGTYRIELPEIAPHVRSYERKRAYRGHDRPLPARHGLWTLVSREPRRIHHANGATQLVVTVRCDCGHVRPNMPACEWRGGSATFGCRSCVGRGLAPAQPHQGATRTLTRRSPEHVAREQLPWEQDEDAQEFVQQHPTGGTLDEVGQFFGLTRERIRQIESVALRKLRGADFLKQRLRAHLDALNERELGPRERSTGIARHALSIDELPTMDTP